MDEQNNNQAVNAVIEQIKALIKKGNVARVLVTRDERTILNLPLNVGLAGTLIGLSAAPLALIAAAVASMGLDCKVDVVRTDGSVVHVLSKETGRKAMDFGVSAFNSIKNSGSK